MIFLWPAARKKSTVSPVETELSRRLLPGAVGAEQPSPRRSACPCSPASGLFTQGLASKWRCSLPFTALGATCWGGFVAHTPTESQNHRIVEVGRDLCGSPSPTPLLKQGHLQQAAQDRVQVGLEYLQRRRLQGQGSVTLRGKKFFLLFSWNFLCFSLCPLPLVLLLGTTEKSLAPSS